MDIHISRERKDWVCDFCSDPHPVKTYRAKDVVVYAELDPALGSEGDWEACAECARLIDADDREGLIDRGLAQLASYSWIPEQERRQSIKTIHDKFFESRTYDP